MNVADARRFETPGKMGLASDGTGGQLSQQNLNNETPTTRLAHNFGKQITIESAEKAPQIPPNIALNALVSHAEQQASSEIARGMHQIKRQIFQNPMGANAEREGRVTREETNSNKIEASSDFQ